MDRLTLTAVFAVALAVGTSAKADRPAKATRAKITRAPRRVAPYSTSISSGTPLLVALVVDHSWSTSRPGSEGHVSKAVALADAVNANLEMMLAVASDGVHADTGLPRFKPYFRVVGVGYGDSHYPLLGTGGATRPLGVDELAKTVVWRDRTGNVVDAQRGERMTWVKPRSLGRTSMGEALAHIEPTVAQFVAENPHAPAPVVMHFTDGDYTGIDPLPIARRIMKHRTADGSALMFNVHIGEVGKTVAFPTAAALPALTAQLGQGFADLFHMSSPVPASMLPRVRELFPEHDVQAGARLMVYNASGALLTQLLELGTMQQLEARP